MTKNEALKLALEALVSAYQGKDKTNQVTDAITAIKEALAQPEQDWKIHPKEDAPLVKWAKEQTPPQRTWVGLTDEDKAFCVQSTAIRGSTYELIAAIEAKLKEKNT